MITPDTTATSTSQPATHRIPVAALAIDGAAPEVGDTVEFTLSGTVASVSGEFAEITPTAINGQPIPAGAPAEPDGDEQVMAAAMAADAED